MNAYKLLGCVLAAGRGGGWKKLALALMLACLLAPASSRAQNAYITNWGFGTVSGTVSVIDTKTDTVMAGCGRTAMTADEFRSQQTGSVETIEVARPMRNVAATFRDRAPAYIQDVQTTNINGPAYRRVMTRLCLPKITSGIRPY
jgi:hypothetical protein